MHDACRTRITNSTDHRFILYARRNDGPDGSLGMRLRRVDAGDSHWINLPSLGRSHILTFLFDGESNSRAEGASRLRAMVSTQASTRDTGPRGRRTVRVTVQSEDVVEVEDSSSSRRGGYTVRRGGTLSGADDTEATDEDHDSDEDDLVISWARPSLDEARAACSRHIELHLSEIAGADLQWEGKLKHLLTNYERGQGALKGLLEQAAIQTVSLAADPVVLRKYRLRYKHDTNPVFDTQAHEDDVRTVRDGPSTEAKELGFERREVIQVTEEREVVKHDGHVDLWLRCAPRPRDPAQCWLKASGPSTIWERTPQIQCAQASSSFFLASGLKVLQIALAQSAECRDTLLECAAAFAEQLKIGRAHV